MKIARLSLLCLTAALCGVVSISAQEKKAKKAPVSAPGTARATIGANDITITYSRPKINDPKSGQPRKIWGGLVPYGKVWRTGANAATVLTVSQPIVIGGLELAAGKYSLFTVPTEGSGSKLIINRRTGQWGIPYKEDTEKANELGRLDLQRGQTASPVDPFTISIAATQPGAGRIVFAWADAQYTIDFRNKG